MVAPFYRLEPLPFGSQIRIGRVAGVALMSIALLVDAVRFWFRRSGGSIVANLVASASHSMVACDSKV